MTARSHQAQPRRNISGILIVNKPTDWTSHDVVAKVRNTFRLKKCGHAGTLDPIATGVLVLLLGDATKAAASLISDDKEYLFSLRCGIETDTQDITGTVLHSSQPPVLTPDTVEKALCAYRGDIAQIPPMYSAVKVQGTRLYTLGRKGKEVPREPRTVTIHSLELVEISPPDITLRATCSKGTYIRTLCHDIGRDLGCGGCMASLTRVRSGSFSYNDAVDLPAILSWTPEQLAEACRPSPTR